MQTIIKLCFYADNELILRAIFNEILLIITYSVSILSCLCENLIYCLSMHQVCANFFDYLLELIT